MSSLRGNRRRISIIIVLVAIAVFSSLILGPSSVMAASLSIDSDTLTTDDGNLDGVTVSASGDLTWDGAEEQPGETSVKLQVQGPDGSNWETVATKEESLSGLAGSYEFSFNSVDITSTTSWEESDFVASSDGASKSTELSFRIQVQSSGNLNGGENDGYRTTSSTAKTVMTVQNEESTTGFDASGGVNIQGEDKDPSDNTDPISTDTVLDGAGTVAYSDLTVKSGDDGGTTTLPSGDVQAIGSIGDIDNDGQNDLPYVEDGDIRVIDAQGNSQVVVGDASTSNPDTDKTLMWTGSWQGSGTSIFYVNENQDTIYRVTDGSVSEIASPGNGADAVLGVGDINGDDQDELLFADGSQQIRYIESGGDITKVQNGGLGSNNAIGAGEVADFDGDGTVRAVTVSGSNNIRIIGEAEPTRTITTVSAKKSPVTAADVDQDGDSEIVYLGNDDGKLKYVDNPLSGSPTTHFLRDDSGDKIAGDSTIGVVSE